MLVSALPRDDAPSPQLVAAWEAEEAALMRGDLDAAVQAVLDAWTLPHAAAVRERVAAMQHRTLVVEAGRPQEPRAEAPDPLEPWPDSASGLDVPTLLVTGGHEMPDFPASAALLSKVLPRARRDTLRDAGHLAPMETPEAFRALLLDFAAEVRAPRAD